MKMIAAAMLLAAVPAFAGEGKKDSAKTSDYVKMHEDMADAHKKAAECIKGGKAVDECNADLRQKCEQHMASGHGGMCPAAGMMKHGDGKKSKS